MTTIATENKFFDRFSITDITLMSIIAAAFGALAVYNQILTDLLRSVAGFYGGMIVAGIFPTAGIMAYALIRKRWVAFITMNVMGIAQILFGNPIGFLVLWFTVAHGIGQELALFLFKYPKTGGDWRVWALTGMASMLVVQIPNVAIFGVGAMPLTSFVVPLVLIALPSSAILPAVLTQAVVKIVPSGLLRRA